MLKIQYMHTIEGGGYTISIIHGPIFMGIEFFPPNEACIFLKVAKHISRQQQKQNIFICKKPAYVYFYYHHPRDALGWSAFLKKNRKEDNNMSVDAGFAYIYERQDMQLLPYAKKSLCTCASWKHSQA